MKVILFGVGNYYQEQKEKIKSFGEIEIVAFADNNSTLWNQKVDGILVVSPTLIQTFKFDNIMIMSIYVCEIYSQLLELGIDKHRIIIWDRFCAESVQRKREVFQKKSEVNYLKDSVLIVSTELDYNGGTFASVYAALSLEQKGISVVLAAPNGNKKLIKEIANSKIKLIVCPSLPYVFDVDRQWIQQFKVVMVNTLQMIECVCEVSKICPTLWWIHEPSEMYASVMMKYLSSQDKECLDNLDIYAVSKIAQENFNNSFGVSTCKKILTLGIPDKVISGKSKKIFKTKMVVAIIGAICSLKGQDIFLEAVSMMEDKRELEFWIIGKVQDNDYCQKVRDMAENIVSVKIMGELTRKEIDKAFQNIDVLVCASPEETLSISIIEGMMYGKVCITTLNTGIASYIQDGVNGFVIPSDNAVILVEKLQWIIDNSHQAKEIGKAARKTYEKYFTLKVFGDNLEEILDETEQKWKDQYSISKQLQA